MLGSIDWSRRVANPEALGGREKKLWATIEPVLHRVLGELKHNDLIETVFVQKEVEVLWSCIVKQDAFTHVSNALLHLSDSKEKAIEFAKLNARFGLDEPTIVADYIMSTLSLSVLKTELFKLVLLFNLKRGHPWPRCPEPDADIVVRAGTCLCILQLGILSRETDAPSRTSIIPDEMDHLYRLLESSDCFSRRSPGSTVRVDRVPERARPYPQFDASLCYDIREADAFASIAGGLIGRSHTSVK